MSKTITKGDIALLVANASEMFDETGRVPGLDGEEVPAEGMVPHAKQYISETIDDSKALCDSKTLDTPGLTLVISWLSQKWLQKCQKLAPRGTKNPDQHLSKEQQNECLDSASAELIAVPPGSASVRCRRRLDSWLEYQRKTPAHRPGFFALRFYSLTHSQLSKPPSQIYS